MSASVQRAVDLMRECANDPEKASALFLSAVQIADWIERTDQPVPSSEQSIRSLLLGAAAVLESEYNIAARG